MAGMKPAEAIAPPSRAQSLTRGDVLALCEAAERDWNPAQNRNLVLFFDGTGNILGDSTPTNVVKLWALAEKSEHQITYYDPGVGTSNDVPPDSLLGDWRQRGRRLAGLAFGGGVHENILDGYRFLIRHHRPGDRIFLLGFSRGAFTARAIGGMVNMYGLIHDDGLPMLPTMVNTYFADPSDARKAFTAQVHAQLSRGRFPLLHFVGVWDTVETVGGMTGRRITNSGDIVSKRFVHVRHAMSLHETRAQYRPRPYAWPHPPLNEQEQRCRSFDQRWFRGVHSDVGGSYLEAGLSDLTLRWMMIESTGCGLRLQPDATAPEGDPGQPLHDQTLASPIWALTGLDTRPRRVGEPVDPSARPVGGATPASQYRGDCRVPNTASACKARHFRWLGLVLSALAVFFACWLARKMQGQTLRWDAILFDAGQVPTTWLRHVLALAGLSAVAAGGALAWPLAWVARRLAPGAIAEGRRLPLLVRLAHVPPLSMLLLGSSSVVLAMHGVSVVLLPFVLGIGIWSTLVQWSEARQAPHGGAAAKPSAWLRPERWLAAGAVFLAVLTGLHYLAHWPVLAGCRWGMLMLVALATLLSALTLLGVGGLAVFARDKAHQEVH